MEDLRTQSRSSAPVPKLRQQFIK